MPKRTSVVDLQSFLNNFHKEIEDGNVVTITPENVGEDKVVRKILLANRSAQGEGGDIDENAENSADGDEEDVYYLDDEGNCYIKTTPKQHQELKKAAKQAAAAAAATVSPATAATTNTIRRVTRSSTNATTTSKPITVRSTKPLPSTPKRGQKPAEKTQNIVTTNVKEIEGEIGEALDKHNVTSDDNVITTEDIDAIEDEIEEVYEFADHSPEGSIAESEYVVSAKQIRLKPATPESKTAQKYGCSQCNYTSSKKFLITRHMLSHQEERPFKCSLCDRGFKSNIGLANHLNTHLGKRPHQCKLCESAFTTSGELIRHTRYKHTKEKPHKCSECSYASVELTKLRRHMTCHTGERPFQCPHCTYASQDMFKLKRHLVTHTGEKKYQCDICKSRFTQSNSLKSHKLIHSVVDKPVFQCTLCPTTCGRKADLRQHMTNMHNSDKPIPCKRCGQELPDRYQYKLHIKTHDGEKCYRCTLCSYASVSQRHLDSHMLIHTDEKPFKCEECPMEFRQRQLLKRHVNLFHTEDYKPPQPRDKMHSCPTCMRTFTHKGNLMRHMETHDPTLNNNGGKINLKLGRTMRMQPDGSVVAVVNESIKKELAKDAEIIEKEEYIDFNELIENDDDVRLLEVEQDGETVIETVTLKNERISNNPPVIINRQLKKPNKETNKNRQIKQSITKTFRIKEEPDATEFTIEVDEDEQEQEYVVLEVIDDDVEVKTETNKKVSKISTNNCFGFESDANADSYDELEENEQITEVDGSSQEFMQLMDIIELES